MASRFDKGDVTFLLFLLLLALNCLNYFVNSSIARSMLTRGYAPREVIGLIGLNGEVISRIEAGVAGVRGQ